MKKILLLMIFTVVSLPFCNAQEIEMEKNFGRYEFSREGKELSMNEVVAIMELNEEAEKLMKNARTNTRAAMAFAGAGVLLMGFPLGQAIAGGKGEWAIAGAGAGLIMIGIPIVTAGNKKAKEAVGIYNSSLNPTTFRSLKRDLRIISNRNGIGFSMTF